MSKRGLFIVLEGMDGSGTTTQATLLAQHLRMLGRSVVQTREPSDGRLGAYIRTLLANGDPVLEDPVVAGLLFTADRRQHVESVLLPALAEGHVVISDRYLLSTMVYQTAAMWQAACSSQANAEAHALVFGLAPLSSRLRDLHKMNEFAPAPDITVVLEVSASVAKERRRSRGSEETAFEEESFQSLIADHYKNAKELLPETHHIKCLDGACSTENVAEQIRRAIGLAGA